MASAKDIEIKPISFSSASKIIKSLHYSGKVCNGTQVNFGVFLDGKCGGAIQMGASLDKRHIVGLVKDTKWNEFIEINRIALADWMPRNGESRSIAICLRILKKAYPHIKWVISYADGTQCGDGTIYRACGFVLTGIKKNTSILRMPDGGIYCEISFTTSPKTIKKYGRPIGTTRTKWLKSRAQNGWTASSYAISISLINHTESD